MSDDEHLVAEQTVPGQQQDLTVRISQHRHGEFWRVDFRTRRGQVTTTVAPGDSFMMHLISEAVGGQEVAWRHLAEWGRAGVAGPAGGPRAVI